MNKFYYRALLFLINIFMIEITTTKRLYLKIKSGIYKYIYLLQMNINNVPMKCAVFYNMKTKTCVIVNMVCPEKSFYVVTANPVQMIQEIRGANKTPINAFKIDFTKGIDFMKTMWPHVMEKTNFSGE